MGKLFKKEIGITLIALVITIVVLIILAAVAINLSLGKNGIFNRAKTGKELYQNAEEYENMKISGVSNQIDSYIGGTRGGTSKIGEFEFTDTDYVHNTYTIDLGFKPSFVYLYLYRGDRDTYVIKDVNNNKYLVYDTNGNRGETYVQLEITDSGFTFHQAWWGLMSGTEPNMHYVAVQ